MLPTWTTHVADDQLPRWQHTHWVKHTCSTTCINLISSRKFDTYLAFFFMVVDGWASTPWSNCCCLSESAEFRCWNTFVLACRILHGLSHSQYKIESQYRTPTFTYINRLAPVPLVTCLFRRDQQTTHCFYLIVRYIWRTTTAMIVSKSSQYACSIGVSITGIRFRLMKWREFEITNQHNIALSWAN